VQTRFGLEKKKRIAFARAKKVCLLYSSLEKEILVFSMIEIN
jgi:hypothetical protein